MIRFKFMLTPWATSCRSITTECTRSYLYCYIFGIRVAILHLDR